MKMKKDKNTERNSSAKIIGNSIGKYLRDNAVKLVAFLLTFVITVALSFVRITMTNTISTYNINDYEVGQISDITVIAMKSLPADSENPISVENGEKVVKKGFPITEEGYAKLKRMSESKAYIDYRSFANSILYLMLVSALYFFLFSKVCLGKTCSQKEFITENIFFVADFACTVFASKTVFFSSPYTVNMILPGVFCSFLMAILFGQLDAVYFAILSSFGVLSASGYQLVPFIFNLCVSLSASRILRRIERRIDLVFASLLQGLLAAVFLMVLKIIFNDTMITKDIFAVAGVMFNGFMSGILCLGFLTPLEYILNSASVFRLMDLSDTNLPVIKKMQVTASGTWNHSNMVANLAEAACSKIGANTLLARVGGYYHDIGKLDNPEFFTENQVAGENIHNDINPSLSVTIIKNHVRKGVEMAKEMRLPPQVVDIIAEHHGNSVLKYFFNAAKQDDPNVNPGDYAYNGNPPSTRESGIVMLADTVEAACKSLETPSPARIEKFVKTLVNAKIEENQLNNCDLTFKDIKTIEETFTQILIGYYHSRVKYPDQKDPDTGKAAEAVLGEKTLDQAKGNITSSQVKETKEKKGKKNGK